MTYTIRAAGGIAATLMPSVSTATPTTFAPSVLYSFAKRRIPRLFHGDTRARRDQHTTDHIECLLAPWVTITSPASAATPLAKARCRAISRRSASDPRG